MIPLEKDERRRFRVFFNETLAWTLSRAPGLDDDSPWTVLYTLFVIPNVIYIAVGYLIDLPWVYFLVIPVVLLILYYTHPTEPVKNVASKRGPTDPKREIICRIAQFAEPTLLYDPDSHIPETVVEQSKLFGEWQRFSGSHRFHGAAGTTVPDFSFVKALRDGTKIGMTIPVTVFSGMFLVQSLASHLRGTTIVVPDAFRDSLSRLVKGRQTGPMQREDLAYSPGDRDFEKRYAVFTTDPGEAAAILTPGRMRSLLDFDETREIRPSISWTGDVCFAAIPVPKNPFVHPKRADELELTHCEQIFVSINMCIELGKQLSPGAAPEN